MPGEVTVTVFPSTVHVNVAEPVANVESVAVSVTVPVPTFVGVPEIAPEALLMVTPAGKPAPDQVNDVSATFESTAEPAIGEIATPAAVDCAGGAVTVIVFGSTPLTTTACETKHEDESLEYEPCIAKVPAVPNVMFCAPPVPPVPTHAHLSPFS